MASVSVGTYVSTRPERVFQVASDIAGSPAVIPSIEQIEIHTDGPIGLGTRWSETRKHMGMSVTLQLEISQFDAPRSYSVRSEMSGMTTTTRFIVDPDGDGSMLTIEVELQPKTMIAKLTQSLMKSAIRKGMEGDLKHLKAAAETV